VNIRDIAKQTGFSHTTVSRALNGSPLISEKTKQVIQARAEELGYVIDASARSLATGIRNTVGILYPYSNLRRIGSQHTSEVIESMRNALREKNLDAIVNGYDTIGERMSEIPRLLREKKVDALIILGYEVTAQVIEEITRYTSSYLLVNPDPKDDLSASPAITIDNIQGGALAYEHLAATTEGKLLVVSSKTPQFEARVAGFADNDPSRVDRFYIDDESYQSAYRSTMENSEFIISHRGIFVTSDVMAMGVMNALLDLSVSVPDTCSLVGYDDIEWCSYSRPSLSTIHQPRSAVAHHAAQIIERMVFHKSEAIEKVHLLPTWVERQSTRTQRQLL